MDNNPRKAIVIVGPTASGKTSIAVNLAKQIDGEVVSADSRQVYRYMDIGTAKPAAEEMDGIPHYGFDIVDPDEWYSAGRFANEAREWIADIFDRDKTPIIAGGSGLYIQALVDGFFEGDIKDPDVRENLEHRLEKEGLTALYDELKKIDPAYSEKTLPNDRQRILRALEVSTVAGVPFSQFHERKHNKAKFETTWFGLEWSREILYERINQRVDIMLNHGLLAEVKDLLDRGYRDTNALKSVGYEEIISFLDGNLTSIEEASDLVKQNTRHYAKRQWTWFRRDQRINWIDCESLNLLQVTDIMIKHM